MKILVVSLLRLGDLVMVTPVIAGLRKKYPQAEIHLLTNDSNRMITPLISGVSKIHYLERETLQKSLGQAEIPLFWGYHQVQELTGTLNKEHFAISINLTHTRISGYLMGMVDANEKQGLVIDTRNRTSFGSSWFRYLNDISTTYRGPKFHFTDVFSFATETPIQKPILQETEAGIAEAQAFLGTIDVQGEILVIQTQTSDEKKNWVREKWQQFIGQLAILRANDTILLLGAPAERAELEAIRDGARQFSGLTNIHVAITKLQAAYSILERASFVLSVDTSIKHMASATDAPIVELSLGSSDYQQTGVYTSGAYIVRSKEKCAPCAHSSPCSQPQRVCATNTEAHALLSVVAAVLGNQKEMLPLIAEEWSDQIEILETQLSNAGFWLALPLDAQASRKLDRVTELAAWKFMLTQNGHTRLADYGSVGITLRHAIFDLDAENSDFRNLDLELSKEETALTRAQSDLYEALKLWSRDQGSQKLNISIADKLSKIEEFLKCGELLTEKWNEREGQGLGRIRAIQNQFDDILRLNQIQLKILRTLEQHERGQNE